MKRFIPALLLFGLAASALGADRLDLDARMRTLTYKLQAMQAKPDKRIPPDQLRQARGIILLDRTKAGFLFAYQGGSGVALLRDPHSGQWSAPSFLRANEASLGFQIGGQQSFVVILLMDTNASQPLLQPNFRFGGEAGGTAGHSSGQVEGAVATDQPAALVYTDREGLFGGAAVKGDSIAPDSDANFAYYGHYLSPEEILRDHKAQPTPAATELIQTLAQASRPLAQR